MTQIVVEATVDPAGEATLAPEAGSDEVLADLLIEEISIDGMCGVY